MRLNRVHPDLPAAQLDLEGAEAGQPTLAIYRHDHPMQEHWKAEELPSASRVKIGHVLILRGANGERSLHGHSHELHAPSSVAM